jgi:hypothetical protein
MTSTTYPRFLGMDGTGDFVWELENGRWTWGADPWDAIGRVGIRTFTPAEYIDKYGRPIAFVTNAPDGKPVLAEDIDRKAESLEDPEELAKLYAPEPVLAPTSEPERKAERSLALYTLLTVLDGWIRGARENHGALDHAGRESRGEECWRSYAPSDIRHMINDAARELGLSAFPAPANPEEDQA